MVPYLPPKRLGLFFVLHLWFSLLLSYHLSLTLALTFLQKMEARALTRRTLTTPMMNVKMDERRKHHHFLSFKVWSKFSSILRSQIENAHLEAIIVADRVIGALRHAGSQYSHCQVEKNSMINPLSMLALSPAKKTHDNFCVLASEPTKKWFMVMSVISLKVNWALTKVFLLLGHMATKPLGRPGQS